MVTRGFGDNLARKLVTIEDYTRFELRDASGFYNAAQTKWTAEVAKHRQTVLISSPPRPRLAAPCAMPSSGTGSKTYW